MNIAIIFAGGSGVRMGAGIPKQFLEINGKPVIVHTLDLFENHREIDKIYISVLKDYIPYMQKLVNRFNLTKVSGIVAGGETGQDSIYNALSKAREENPGDSIVLIHDGVRPWITYETISRNIAGVKENGNAITCTACFETILMSTNGKKVETVPYRKDTFAAQAPQSFYLDDILDAHEQVRKTENRYDNLVDSCTLIKSIGREAFMVEGNRGNIKVTTPEDVYMYRALLQYKENEQAFGIGLTPNNLLNN
ncbi:MAG: 2-C-methyl-D-erythritol 4-phosphate cytidylyltransferase [Oscillospiraceae bacterium]|nr:2-C-methyl-D-erythritol 4-phosphate cytidylyltransferase [Oscillospiraceae bacterium]MBQ8378921.1 2-C-methyl-D-erythritol 4-phosphate cytidylyltransferase [Oscillospiraceae bacterium]MBQ8884463.1 2-C-methyl-D-erythritol 4-phosphate cytidylyltransferase [Oscillospiraceae bacterium]